MCHRLHIFATIAPPGGVHIFRLPRQLLQRDAVCAESVNKVFSHTIPRAARGCCGAAALMNRTKRQEHPEEYYTRSDLLRLAVYLAFNIMVHCCILFSEYIFCGARGEREPPDSF